MSNNTNATFKIIGERVKALREKQNLSAEQLALKTELTPEYISKIENAEIELNLDAFIKIAKVLNCDLDTLIGKDDAKLHEVLDRKIDDLLEDCSEEEAELILKEAMRVKKEMRSRKE